MNTTAKKIDADITAALDRWAAAIGTPDHQTASEALDDLLEGLCDDRRARDRTELLVYLMDTASDTGLVIRHEAPNPEAWMHDDKDLFVIAVRHGETVWDALQRSYRQNARNPRPARGA